MPKSKRKDRTPNRINYRPDTELLLAMLEERWALFLSNPGMKPNQLKGELTYYSMAKELNVPASVVKAAYLRATRVNGEFD